MRRLRLELAVLAALLVSFLTIPLPLPHVATATAWLVLTTVHVARRRRTYAALLRSAGRSAPPTVGRLSAVRHRWRGVATTVLIGCAAVVALSGFAQWAGLAAAIPWHAASSSLLAVLAVAHAARRLWWARRRHGAVRRPSPALRQANLSVNS